MVQAGMSMSNVARQFNVSHVTISNLVQRFQTTGSVGDRPRSGRPRVTDARTDWHIVTTHLRNRFLSAAQTARVTPGRHGMLVTEQ